MALVQVGELGIETGVVINRPAAVGERLQLRCTAADPRAGHFWLEEVPGPEKGPNPDPVPGFAPPLDSAFATLGTAALQAWQPGRGVVAPAR